MITATGHTVFWHRKWMETILNQICYPHKEIILTLRQGNLGWILLLIKKNVVAAITFNITKKRFLNLNFEVLIPSQVNFVVGHLILCPYGSLKRVHVICHVHCLEEEGKIAQMCCLRFTVIGLQLSLELDIQWHYLFSNECERANGKK